MAETCHACHNGGTIPEAAQDVPLCREHWNRYLILWANYEVSGGAHVIRKRDR